MIIEQALFYFFAFVVLGSALLVVTIGNIVRSVFLFFVTLFALAGLYVFSLADFIAVTQVVIYAGGVLILMLFAFMLSKKELLDPLLTAAGKRVNLANIPAVLIVLSLLFILIKAVLGIVPGWIESPAERHFTVTDNSTTLIGINLMTRYLLPFEVVSVFLLMALVGAAHLARKEKKT